MAEWYDWYIYAFLAPILATQILPGSKQLAQSLSAFAIFAIGCFLRPIGRLVISLIGMVVLGGFTSISAALNAEIIPGRVRAAGIGLPYPLIVALFGGTAPFIGTWFTELGRPGPFGYWIALLCVVSLVVYIVMPETARRPLED